MKILLVRQMRLLNKNMKNIYKLLFKGERGYSLLFFLVIVVSFIILVMVNITVIDKNIGPYVAEEGRVVKQKFDQIIQLDTRTLAATLRVAAQDEKIKEIFLEKDREKLYSYVSPLFEDLKTKYKITHWYFVTPEGNVFLRVHEKDAFNEKYSRADVLLKNKEKNTVSSGITLGNKNYALRVGMPYYDNDKLIGYIELGQEIDHILDLLTNETRKDVILVTKKEYMKESDWGLFRSKSNLRNNWGDLNSYVLMSPKTDDGLSSYGCFNEKNMSDGDKGKYIFQEIKKEGKTFKCLGFPLVDASGKQSGMILFSLDLKHYLDIKKNSILTISVFAIIILVLVSLMALFLTLKRKQNNKQ